MKLLFPTLLFVLLISLTVNCKRASSRRFSFRQVSVRRIIATPKTTASSGRGQHVLTKTFVKNNIIDKMKAVLSNTRPIYRKEIAYPVCKRAFTAVEQNDVIALKNVLSGKPSNKCGDTANKISNLEYHSRIRRTAEEDAVLTELGLSASDGAIATQVSCTEPTSADCGTLNMCRTCQYNIELPDTYFPQYHVHFTCGKSDGDISCLLGEGACVKQLREQWILHDTAALGAQQMHQWTQQSITFNTGCSCRVVENGLFSYFV